VCRAPSPTSPIRNDANGGGEVHPAVRIAQNEQRTLSGVSAHHTYYNRCAHLAADKGAPPPPSGFWMGEMSPSAAQHCFCTATIAFGDRGGVLTTDFDSKPARQRSSSPIPSFGWGRCRRTRRGIDPAPGDHRVRRRRGCRGSGYGCHSLMTAVAPAAPLRLLNLPAFFVFFVHSCISCKKIPLFQYSRPFT